jgi:lipoyl-dependent peroxiredoxin
MQVLYKTTAVSDGGRNGSVKVENSPLNFEMVPPAEMGGKNMAGINPEQLFAAGYSACFGSAIQHVIRGRKLPIAAPTVQITIGLGINNAGGYSLTADIVVTITGVNQELADILLRDADMVCPYSNAIRGNMDVTLVAIIK